MTRLRGRAPRRPASGGELSARPLENHHDDLLRSLGRHERLHDNRRATNTKVIQAYVREILVPTLRSGDIVVLYNLGAYKNEATLALISAAGAQTRFLPAYSQDLNPIELIWSMVKALLLRDAEARSESALLQAITQALAAVTANDAKDWFAHYGYSLT